jgi:flavin-dependent dehydrogenase
MSQPRDYLVAVVGGGPAGAITARGLAQQGIAVVLFDQLNPEFPGRYFPIGEGLPPGAREILQTLGIWEAFLAAGHQPAYGNCSAWGSDTLIDNDFLRNPYGQGWHLDRALFDSELRRLAVQAGVRLLQPVKVLQCQPTADGFTVYYQLSTPLTTITTQTLAVRAVVDATGRSSKLAQSFGATKIVDDRLMGFAVRWPTLSSDQDSRTLVEAVFEGWWYSALLPQQQRIAVYFTDPDLPSAKLARSISGWRQLLAATNYLRRFSLDLVENNVDIVNNIDQSDSNLRPRALAAGSSRLLPPSGPQGWLAVGDAAAAFDPLSSQGIVSAMEGAQRAAITLTDFLNNKFLNNKNKFSDYNRWLANLYFTYRHNYAAYYQLEQRWPDSIFWQRRQY